MRKPVIMTGILVFLCLSVAVAQVNEPSLPPNLKIIPPGAGVPPRLAQLSGIWEGTYAYVAPLGGGGRHKTFHQDIAGYGVKIAIVEITPQKVEAIYAMGGSSQKPGKWFRVKDAAIAGDAIVLRWGQPGKKKTVTLRPTGNPGVAEATLESEGTAVRRDHKATLRKK